MKSNRLSVRSPRVSLWLASLTAAGLLPLGGTRLAAQTADTWNGGTGSWSDGTFWSTGSIPNDASADVSIDGGKTGTASVVNLAGSYTVGRLTLDAGDTLNVGGDQTFTVSAGGFNGSGTLTNNGIINVSSPGGGHYTNLRFAGPGTLAGTGTVNLSGSQTIFAANTYNDRITIGAGQTVAGQGNVGNAGTNFTNNGTVTANVNGALLTLNPTSNGTGDFTNVGAGAARAENGGVLELAGGATFNGGTFSALAGSAVQVDNNATVNNATLATSGTGQVAIGRVAATLSNVTVAAASTVNVSNGSDVTLTGTLTNNGTVNVSSPGDGHYAFLRVNGPTTLAGTGTVNLSGFQTVISSSNAGDRLTIGSSATIAGVGNVGEGRTTFTNNGRIYANTNGGTLILQPGGGTADFTNASSGSLTAYNGGTLAFSNASGGTLTNNGTIEADSGSTVTIPAGALTNLSGTTLTGGRYLAYGSGTNANNPATLSFGGGNIVTNNASVLLAGANSVFNEINAVAAVGASGQFSLLNGRNFTTAGALTNAGSIGVNSTVANNVPAACTLTVAGNFNNSGQTAVGVGTLAVQGSVTNSGQLLTNGAITASGPLTQTAGGTLAGSGSIAAPTLALGRHPAAG